MKEKLLKLSKGLNKFCLDDLIIMSEEDEDDILFYLDRFIKAGAIKKIGEDNYLFLKNQEIKDKSPVKKAEVKKIKDKNLAFKDAGKAYIETSKGKCSPSTLASYRSILSRHLVPYFGRTNIKKITVETVKEFIKQKEKEGLSAATIRHCRSLLGSIIEKELDRIMISINNPVYRVKEPEVKSLKPRILDKSEIEQLLKTAKDAPADIYPLVYMAIHTGMTRGELLALSWDNIKVRGKIIVVKNRMFRKEIIPMPKYCARKIDISNDLFDVLVNWKFRCPTGDMNLVFPNTEGNPRDADNLTKRKLIPLIHKAGIKNARFSDLRHTFAALLLEQRPDMQYLKSQIGHKSVQTTEARYGHLIN